MIKSLKEKYPDYDQGRKKSRKVQSHTKKKEEDKKNENELRKKELLEAKIRHQVACEEKAFRIVERLIENPVAEDFLIDACQFISPQHYEDIVEERAITKTCGYPLCSKTLTSVLKQKYHISTKDNKVYDITERKNFCSNQCYKASKYLQEQLSTFPLWAREEQHEKVKIKLMTLNSGLPGIEVVGPTGKLMKEVHQLSKMDALDSRRSMRDQDKNNIDECVRVKENLKSNEKQDSIEEISLKTEILSFVEPEIRRKIPELDSDDENDDLVESPSITSRDNTVGNKASLEKVASTSLESTSAIDVDKESSTAKNIAENTGNQESQTEDKMQHLMKLLDRRKQLLSQLADIDSVETKQEKPLACASDSKTSHETRSRNSHFDASIKSDVTVGESTGQLQISNERLNTNTESDRLIMSPETRFDVDTKQSITKNRMTDPEKSSLDEVGKGKTNPHSSVKTDYKQSSRSVIQMICQSMQSWITPETVLFVQPEDKATSSINQSRADYDAMYKALCRRIDAGEFEIDDVGKEAEIDGEERYRQRMPNYEMLKLETDGFTDRVKQYFVGDVPAKSLEKEDKDKTPVYLPTVDSYDQMQIRRKIVMDKLQRVLSDVLSPLKLTIQDVYTEYKEIIATFRLDSKNILFKPAEWTVVNLILLRMMSKRNEKIHKAFLLPSSVSYFTFLLGKLGTNLQQIDSFINEMLLLCQ